MFRELYYRLFESLKGVKTNTHPAFNAYLGISSFQCINVATLLAIINYFLKIDVSKNTSVYIGILLYIFLTVINFFYLFRKKDELGKKFDKMQMKRQNIG